MLSRRIVQSRTSNLDLDAPGCLGNVDRLDTHLTVDNVRFAPCAYLVADDVVVGTGAWASRHNTSKALAVAGAGAAPTYGNYTALENTAVTYATGKYHTAADTTWGQLTTGDWAAELVLKSGTTVSSMFMSNLKLAAPLIGLCVYFYSDSAQLVIDPLYNGTEYASLVPYAAKSIAHVFVLADKSEKYYVYVNGVYAASVDISAAVGSLDGSAKLTLADHPGGAGAANENSVILCGLWDLPSNPFPGALKNRTYFDRIARERFAIVAGIQDRRQGAHTFTRATPAYLDKWTPGASTKSLYRVSAGWPRICERDDANSKRVRRYLAELQRTNLCIQSEDLATTWTAHNLTTVSSNAAIAPNGETTADGVVGNATDTAHGVNQDLTLPATMHCFSTHAKPGDKDWIHLTTGITNVSGYFDVANGVVGTIGAAVTASGIEPHPYLNGYYRCWINFTGSADSKSYYLLSAQADGDNTFAGDTTTINTYFWGTQIEATTEYFPSSYIPTAAAAVARNKDELLYRVRLPVIRNIDDLPQALTIGGTDYAPCAFLVADDCQSDGTWTSRHAAKSLAFAGAGTNPTPQWNAVSRANNTVRYWASNYHAAADTTWGQIGNNDGVVEVLFVSMDGSTISTRASGSLLGYDLGVSSGATSFIVGDGTNYISATASPVHAVGTLVHFMAFIDKSDKVYFVVNGVYFGVSASTASVGDSTGGTLSFGALSGGVSATAGQLALFAAWNLPTNPLPGAATNAAVCTAIARARFDQLCQPTAMRLDCEILHPNVNRQAKVSLVDLSINQLDYNSLMLDTDDYGIAQAGYNNTWAWNSSTTKGSTDLCDNVSRKLSIAARENNARYKENNATIASDTSCEIPTTYSVVRVGMWADNNFQPSCLVGGVKLWRSDK